MEYSGVVRIRNPKTLNKWIKKGWYKEKIDNGFVFNVGCGRFTRPDKCECGKCRKSKNSPMNEIIDML